MPNDKHWSMRQNQLHIWYLMIIILSRGIALWYNKMISINHCICKHWPGLVFNIIKSTYIFFLRLLDRQLLVGVCVSVFFLNVTTTHSYIFFDINAGLNDWQEQHHKRGEHFYVASNTYIFFIFKWRHGEHLYTSFFCCSLFSVFYLPMIAEQNINVIMRLLSLALVLEEAILLLQHKASTFQHRVICHELVSIQ